MRFGKFFCKDCTIQALCTLTWFSCLRVVFTFLKDKSGVDMINATKQTYQLLARIIIISLHYDVRNSYILVKHSANLGQTSLQHPRYFLTKAR